MKLYDHRDSEPYEWDLDMSPYDDTPCDGCHLVRPLRLIDNRRLCRQCDRERRATPHAQT